LADDEIVAAIDLETDRQIRRRRVQKWTCLVEERAGLRATVDAALDKFEDFHALRRPIASPGS
jgi:uncharacterized protein